MSHAFRRVKRTNTKPFTLDFSVSCYLSGKVVVLSMLSTLTHTQQLLRNTNGVCNVVKHINKQWAKLKFFT